MRLVLETIDGSIFRQHDDIRIIPRNDVEQRHGYDNVSEYVVELIGQSGVWKNKARRRICGASYKKGKRQWTEYRLENDSINPDDAIGYIRGRVYDEQTGIEYISESDLFDQCSAMRISGRPFLAPDLELLGRYFANWTDLNIPSDQLAAIRAKLQPGGYWSKSCVNWGQDHWGDPNRPGTPHARYMDKSLLAWRLFPGEDGAVNQTAEWMAIQYGTHLHDPTVGLIERPGRPYHLHDYDTGGFVRPYRADQMAGGHPSVYGTLETGFGRGNLPPVNAAELGPLWGNDLAWTGKRLIFPADMPIPYGGEIRYGGRISSRGWGPISNEHRHRCMITIAHLLLTGSIAARNEIVCYLEAPIMSDGMPGGWDHSDRAVNWAMLVYALGGFALREERYWKIARKIRDWSLAASHLPEWAREDVIATANKGSWNQPVLVSGSWQLGIGAEACRQAEELESDRTEANLSKWRELRSKIEKILDRCVVYTETGKAIGLAYEYFRSESGFNPSVEANGGPSWIGSRHWCANGTVGRPWNREAWEWYRSHARDWRDEDEITWHWHAKQRMEYGP